MGLVRLRQNSVGAPHICGDVRGISADEQSLRRAVLLSKVVSYSDGARLRRTSTPYHLVIKVHRHAKGLHFHHSQNACVDEVPMNPPMCYFNRLLMLLTWVIYFVTKVRISISIALAGVQILQPYIAIITNCRGIKN